MCSPRRRSIAPRSTMPSPARVRRMSRCARVEGAVADFAATLTPDERLKLVGAMERFGPLRAVPPKERPDRQE
ncbi:hypothetical protein [Candidatus Burkholderia verschuerenii]|uniref:hypothetical protein n=1 Tax=Candidatus Burkholderia verschuerenii TaxID=242163 RepID=UPI001E5AD71D|nr:hypothetical protein [Candidatus Burkholderia verschuerenii]